MKVKIFILLAVLFLMSTNLSAQSTRDFSLHFFGAYSRPYGDFGANIGPDAEPTRRFGFDIGEKAGLANNGYGLGVELMSAVWFEGMQWIFSVNYLTNSTETSALEPVFNAGLTNLEKTAQVDLEVGSWTNIPILSGFRYDVSIGSGLAVYTTLMGGMNFSKRPSLKAVVDVTPTEGSPAKAHSDVIAEDTEFKFARDFGYATGFGILYKQRFNIGVRYYNLRHPKYEGTRKLSEKIFPRIFSRENNILGDERAISMIVMTFGVKI